MYNRICSVTISAELHEKLAKIKNERSAATCECCGIQKAWSMKMVAEELITLGLQLMEIDPEGRR